MPEIMRAGKVTGRGPDAGPPEECSHGTAEAAAAVAASTRTAMPEERAVRLGRQSPPAANRDQVLDLAGVRLFFVVSHPAAPDPRIDETSILCRP